MPPSVPARLCTPQSPQLCRDTRLCTPAPLHPAWSSQTGGSQPPGSPASDLNPGRAPERGGSGWGLPVRQALEAEPRAEPEGIAHPRVGSEDSASLRTSLPQQPPDREAPVGTGEGSPSHQVDTTQSRGWLVGSWLLTPGPPRPQSPQLWVSPAVWVGATVTRSPMPPPQRRRPTAHPCTGSPPGGERTTVAPRPRTGTRRGRTQVGPEAGRQSPRPPGGVA